MVNDQTQVITIYSPKGGTGKTTLAAQMALAYAKQGKKVLIIDIAQFGNIGSVLKLNMKGPGLGNIISFFEFADTGDPIEQIKIIKEAVQTFKDDPYSFDIIISAQPVKMEDLDPERTRKTIAAAKQIGYDYIIIDTSSDICLRNIEAMLSSNAILLLCDQDVSTIWNVLLLKDILLGIDLLERIKVIITRESKHSGMSIDEIENETGLQVFWKFNDDKAIRYYNNQRAGLCRRRERYAVDVNSMTEFLSKILA